MSYSNYPLGFPHGVTIRGLPLTMTNPGKVFWVNNSSVSAEGGIVGSNSNRGTLQKPFATIDHAINQCTAGRGDIIMLAPGHAETVGTATTINMDVQGVAIIGTGTGTLQPSITFDTATTATITVSAADCTFFNIHFIAGLEEVVTGITLSAANLTMSNTRWNEGTGFNFVDCITATATANIADGCHLVNNDIYMTDTNFDSFFKTLEDIDSVVCNDNFYHITQNANQALLLAVSGKDFTHLQCYRNVVIADLKTGGDMVINSDTGNNRGVAAYNLCGHIDTAAADPIDCDGIRLFENYSVSDNDTQGVLAPVADDNA